MCPLTKTSFLIDVHYTQVSRIFSFFQKSDAAIVQAKVVGLERFELSTFRLSAERSSQTELQAHRQISKSLHLLKHLP